MASPSVGPATERDRAVATIMLAFANDPLLRWLYPDPHQYVTAAPGMLEHFAGGAFEHGTSHEAAGYRGVALWLPPGVHSDEEALGGFVASTVAEERHEAVFGLFEQIGPHHPTEPH